MKVYLYTNFVIILFTYHTEGLEIPPISTVLSSIFKVICIILNFQAQK